MILDDILAQTAKTLEASQQQVSLEALKLAAAKAAPPRDFAKALRRTGDIACIAEFKRRSPSKGWIFQDAQVANVVPTYESAGAAAVSVLTDGPFFGGSLEDLRQARARASIPVLRKDFLIDPYQVVEARAAGADAVLLIVAALREPELRALLGETRRWGMEALVETHDREEVEIAVAAGATVIGVNHRDLRTFEMNMNLAVELRPRIPGHCVVVAESGVRNRADVDRLRRAGIDAILVGKTLMAAKDPTAALRALVGDG